MRRQRSRRPSRWIRPGALVVALVAGLLGASGRDSHATSQERARGACETRDADTVQAVFVYNFAARHVKWPDAAFRDKTSAFVVGVLGAEPILGALIETCRDRKSGERPIEVRRLDDVAAAAACQIVFLPASREADLPAVLEACKGRPILIVATAEASVRRGAHIGFFLEKSKVRFAADAHAAKRAGLEVSSELLKLARVVEKEGSR